MKPVNQRIIRKGRGDCMRAALASLFDLELDQVPHFILWENWHPVFWNYLRGIGYEYVGCEYPHNLKLYKKYSVGGYYYAGVPSRTFKNVSHAVIIDRKGIVRHDPNPNKKWMGVNIVRRKHLYHVYLFEKIKRKRRSHDR